MKTLTTKSGHEILLDDADYEDVSRHKWCVTTNGKHSYASRNSILLHRYLMRVPKGVRVEIINGNGLDCRRENLAIHVAGARTRPYKPHTYTPIEMLPPEKRIAVRERGRDRNREKRKKSHQEVSEAAKAAAERYREKNRDKINARCAVRYAVMMGKVEKPSNCCECGKQETPRRLHAHHDDYGKPMNVEFLCTECHGKRHQKPIPAELLAIPTYKPLHTFHFFV
jgi:hypothetical protein